MFKGKHSHNYAYIVLPALVIPILVSFTFNSSVESVLADSRYHQYINESSTNIGESKTGTYKSNSDLGYYKKLTYDPNNIKDNYCGNYLIVYENSSTEAYIFNGSTPKGTISGYNNHSTEVVISDGKIYNTTNPNVNHTNNEWVIEINKSHSDGYSYYNVTSYLHGYQIGTEKTYDVMDYWETKSKDENINYIELNSDSSISIKSLNQITLAYDVDWPGFRYKVTPATKIYLYEWVSYYSDAKSFASSFKSYFTEAYYDVNQTRPKSDALVIEKFKDANDAFLNLPEGARKYFTKQGGDYIYSPKEGDTSLIGSTRDRCDNCMFNKYGLYLGMDSEDIDEIKGKINLYKNTYVEVDSSTNVTIIIVLASSILILMLLVFILGMRTRSKKKH